MSKMSLEEYHVRQQANEARNRAREGEAARHRTKKARRHLQRALELLDREANPGGYREIEKALASLA